MRDLREFVTLPESWCSTASRWRDTPFTWKRWNRYSENWTHDHCEFCLACICNHRDRFPQRNFDRRGCYRHAYYAERADGPRIWVCKDCFERVQAEFGWSIEEDLPGAA
jgi:hypothetical protein